jgi:hypothetical protein
MSLENRLWGVVITMLRLLYHETWHHILVQERISTLASE